LPDVKKQQESRIINQGNQKIDVSIAIFLSSNQHKQFMSTYGVLIKDLRLKRIGPILTILTPTVDFLLKFLIAVGVTILVNWPTFTIYFFNFGVLFYL
jgi:hypothetical protein